MQLYTHTDLLVYILAPAESLLAGIPGQLKVEVELLTKEALPLRPGAIEAAGVTTLNEEKGGEEGGGRL